MASKATKKAAKKASKKNTSRRSIPYIQIAKMVQAGADALTIAKKIGRVNDGEDKTHTVRAIISGMRTRGWKDESGKLQRLKVARVGRVEKPKKAKKKMAVKKTAPKPIAATTSQLDGKTLAAGGQ
jgi:hypothetical protein